MVTTILLQSFEHPMSAWAILRHRNLKKSILVGKNRALGKFELGFLRHSSTNCITGWEKTVDVELSTI